MIEDPNRAHDLLVESQVKPDRNSIPKQPAGSGVQILTPGRKELIVHVVQELDPANSFWVCPGPACPTSNKELVGWWSRVSSRALPVPAAIVKSHRVDLLTMMKLPEPNHRSPLAEFRECALELTGNGTGAPTLQAETLLKSPRCD